MVRFALIALALLLGSIAAVAQKPPAGPPAPASQGAVYGPPTPPGFVESPRVIHVVGDGVNYYKFVGGPPKPSPPAPPTSSLGGGGGGSFSPRSEGFKPFESGLKKDAKAPSPPTSLPPASDFLEKEAKRMAEARRAHDAMVAQMEAEVITKAVAWCNEQARKFHPVQEKARADQKKAREQTKEAMAPRLEESIDTVRDDSYERVTTKDERPEEKSETKYKREFDNQGPRIGKHIREDLADDGLLTEVTSAHPINNLGGYVASEVSEAWGAVEQARTALYEMAMAGLDIGLGIMPIAGPSRSAVEAATGVNLITGEELSTLERGMAVAVVATAGTLAIVKEAGYAFKALPALPKAAAAEAGAVPRVYAVKNALLNQSAREAAKTFPESIQVAERMLHLKDVQYFGPILQGPLPREVADSFRSSTYFQGVLKEDRLLYRVVSDAENVGGRFLTSQKPLGRRQLAQDLALIPEYENAANYVVTFRVPKGTMVYEGIVGPQTSATFGVVRPGGANQVFLDMSPRLIDKWKIGVEVLP